MEHELIEKLAQRLKQPLPGSSSHQKMKPVIPSGFRFRTPPEENARKGAVLIMLYKKNGQWFFPLIQRPLYEGIHSGQVALPGGRKEEQDVDIIATALRESQEEIGLGQNGVTVLGCLSDFFVAVSNYMVTPVIGYYQKNPVFEPDDREVAEVIEAPLNQLLDIGLLKEKEITASSGYKLHSPYFEIENKVVWGATAMMLSELVDVIREL
ncbi:CoA pyrophosphatase [Marinoscillum sp. MHG1-6]|uniref:NUDIX hydrolase n=1 Tax=Marinoscillum sp. MHG1-6 TaxID=2959627 RepID=UPI0021583227|nr:CoA pyrophosphatase [Marinoscillum sp. MHG1-6]